jgi:drug/metabolite transporter (DMT)-like permease
VVGPVYALSPIFTVVPDAVLSGTLPTPLGFVGVGLAVAGTVGLSRGAASGGTLRGLFRRPDAVDALLAAIFLGVLSAVDRWAALALGALTMAPASYVNAVRRLSGLIAVVLGGTLFREAEAGRRLVAAALACAGAVCLLLAR